MKICKKCLGNDWKIKRIKSLMTATCNLCGNYVKFETTPKKKKKVEKTFKHTARVIKRPREDYKFEYIEKLKSSLKFR